MNWYEERQQAKRDRLRVAAAKRHAEAKRLSDEGWAALQAIPFGQPILVGHHSERSDRAYRGRAVGKIDKSVAISNYAHELDARAETVGTGGISSHDPEAVQKLDVKLGELQEAHAFMVERNKEARQAVQPKPFMAYQITNSGANIRRIQKRIAELERMKAAPQSEAITGDGWSVSEDKDDNRILFTFAAIPSEEVRAVLKRYGFKWSPLRKAWVRKITGNARLATRQAIEQLRKL